MSKAYIIDENLLLEQELTIEEYLTLLCISRKLKFSYTQELLDSLQQKLFIKQILDENEKILIIREKGNKLIDYLEIEGLKSLNNKRVIRKSNRQINQDLDEFIDDFRKLWKGLKMGSMGSKEACIEKMTRWMQANPSYSKEDILKASKIYLDSLNDYTYLQQADYFIYKKDVKGESSRLSAFIDEDIVEDNWTNNLK